MYLEREEQKTMPFFITVLLKVSASLFCLFPRLQLRVFSAI